MDKASDILKRVRRIELKARHLATENFAGQYQSGFRGQGLDFDDFREYQPGDDPRFIDWKVTARMSSPFVRRFKEEREQALILVVDVSGSMHYASSLTDRSKLDVAAEIAAVLAYSAAQSGDKCGLLLYGGESIQYLHPSKGMKQTLRIVREILASSPEGKDPGIEEVARQLVISQKKAAMVVMISDFWEKPSQTALGQLNFKHDLIPIRLIDPMELSLPDVGRVILKDPETGRDMYLNLSRAEVRLFHEESVAKRREEWVQQFRRLGIDYLDLQTTDPFMPALKKLFVKRSRQFSR